MSSFEEHEAEQAVLTARYAALCPAGKMLHDEFEYHLDDIDAEGADDQLCAEMGLAKYDEWRADLNEDKADLLDEAMALLSELRDGSGMSAEQKARYDRLVNGEPEPTVLDRIEEVLLNHNDLDADAPLPHWAAARAFGQWVPNAQLCTRDGRSCGNGVLLQWYDKTYPNQHVTLRLASVVTDAGNTMELTENELAERFYPPRWIMSELLPTHHTEKIA